MAEVEGEADGVIVHDCDLDATRFGKETIFDFARHRRIEHYGRITVQTGVGAAAGVETDGLPSILRDRPPRERYKLLCATVVPRPIALVTSIDEAGVVNAAPFSFFNVFSEEPALIVLGLQHKPEQGAEGHDPQHRRRPASSASTSSTRPWPRR